MSYSLLNNEKNLLQQIASGNEKAFEYIFNQHELGLRYFATRLTQSSQEAEDIVLEVFVKWWTNRVQYQSAENIKAFLYVSTRNACLNFIRNTKRKSLAQKEIAYLSTSAEDQNYPFFEMMQADIFQEIYAEIDNLPPRYREVFKLSYFEGLKTDEIAQRLHISVKTVQNQKLVAISRLKTVLLKKNLLPLFILFLQYWSWNNTAEKYFHF